MAIVEFYCQRNATYENDRYLVIKPMPGVLAITTGSDALKTKTMHATSPCEREMNLSD